MIDTNGQPDTELWYEIRVRDRLDHRWAAWLDGLELTQADEGTVMRGPVADQAALHGALRDIGLPLVSVSQVKPTSPHVRPTCPPTGA